MVQLLYSCFRYRYPISADAIGRLPATPPMEAGLGGLFGSSKLFPGNWSRPAKLRIRNESAGRWFPIVGTARGAWAAGSIKSFRPAGATGATHHLVRARRDNGYVSYRKIVLMRPYRTPGLMGYGGSLRYLPPQFYKGRLGLGTLNKPKYLGKYTQENFSQQSL